MSLVFAAVKLMLQTEIFLYWCCVDTWVLLSLCLVHSHAVWWLLSTSVWYQFQCWVFMCDVTYFQSFVLCKFLEQTHLSQRILTSCKQETFFKCRSFNLVITVLNQCFSGTPDHNCMTSRKYHALVWMLLHCRWSLSYIFLPVQQTCKHTRLEWHW